MAYLASFLLLNMFYLWAILRNDLSVIDIFWSLGFWVMSLAAFVQLERPTFFQTVFVVLISLWAIRLSAYLAWRLIKHGVEDKRYTEIRSKWTGNFALNAYLRVFLVQFLLQTIISFPLFFYLGNEQEFVLSANHVLGLFVFIYGLVFEVWADTGLALFKSIPENKGKLYTEGAWRFSQHPNYFGEACIWVGFFIMTLNVSPWWTVFSPILMIFLLVKVSGIPLLKRNEKYDTAPEYRDYQSRTSLLVPWFPEEN